MLVVVASSAGAAYAQDAIVEGKGVKVGEGTVVRPILGIETGWVSNLYYDDTDQTQVAALRLMAAFSTGSAGEERTKVEAPEGDQDKVSQGEPPSVKWALGAKLRYTEYPFSSQRAEMQRNLGADANLDLVIKPQGTFRVELSDKFARDTNPTNFESRFQVNRDVNELKTGLVYQPGGRAITAGLHYQNRIDYFESSDQSFASRIQHQVLLSADWQWLPITKFSFEGSYGIYLPLDNSSWKQESSPISGRIGIASAITEKTFGRASLGWAYAGYSFGEGYNTPVGDLEFGYRYSPTGKFSIAYSYDFNDSINANFFRDHAVLFKLDQQINRWVFDGIFDVRLRGYRGVPPQLMASSPNRDDFVMGVLARLRYLYRDRLSFSGTWRSTVDQTNFRYTAGPGVDNPSYDRHEFMLGATAAF